MSSGSLLFVDPLTDNSEPTRFMVLGAFTLCVMSLFLALYQQYNWDEFLFMSFVHDYNAGKLYKPVNTFHVHLFSWLAALPIAEVSQLRIARLVMWVFQVGTLLFLYKFVSKLFDRRAALFSIITYLSLAFTFTYGTHFRVDPIALFFVAVAMWIMQSSRLKSLGVLVLSLALAMSALITVKVVFFAPVFLGIAFWRLKTDKSAKKTFVQFLIAFVLSVTFFVLLFTLHQWSLGAHSAGQAQKTLSSAYSTTIIPDQFFPRQALLISAFQKSIFGFGVIALGIVIFLFDRAQLKLMDPKWILYLGCFLPVLSFLFYRNAFAYFYPFIMAPLVVFAAIFIRNRYIARIQPNILVVILLLGAVINFGLRLPYDQSVQKMTLAEVNRLFPEPVNYIDHSKVAFGHNSVSFFMSTWGIQAYRDRGEPVFEKILRENEVPLLIANRSVLRDVFRDDVDPNSGYQLLPEDRKVLRENFVHYWGDIYVAGRKILTDRDGIAQFSILVSGEYHFISSFAVSIDGDIYNPGDTISLDRKLYQISDSNPNGEIRLQLSNAGLDLRLALEDLLFYRVF